MRDLPEVVLILGDCVEPDRHAHVVPLAVGPGHDRAGDDDEARGRADLRGLGVEERLALALLHGSPLAPYRARNHRGLGARGALVP
eukprot:CAMPEP_0176111142 /NCGR_PEP_ID=MMETSP0120_2-20121206/55811_1 /TAXON_ID=160619 /ORGANISM="Kryptoperidinium foliaceum, Strain CCMP 1326" /LENGTH=85 /DNA_ID=CAMNT_0017445355 /DNA_START=172 /DNA_END=425 /DNA_ORIENTATION=-